MQKLSKHCLTLVAGLGIAAMANAIETPQHERHELMEGVRDAAKPVGGMLQEKVEYDADIVMESLHTWREAAQVLGDLFPEGSETGEDTEAAPAIWEDRDGFNAAIEEWLNATNAAIDAAPQTLDAARPTVGAVFKNCKGCHDKYRIEDE